MFNFRFSLPRGGYILLFFLILGVSVSAANEGADPAIIAEGNFKAGIRGADPKDVEGMQMRPMAMTVADEASMQNLAAFIHSLGVSSETSTEK